MFVFLRMIKVQLNLFLTAFAVFLFIKDPSASFLTGLLKALSFSVLIEASVLFLKTRKPRITASAVTSGLILGLVLASDSSWEIFLAAALLAVGLKHLLRFRGRNLLNPAACGLFLAVLLFKASTEWKGAYEWLLLVPAGFYIVHRIRRTSLFLSYFVTSLLLFIPQALAQRASLIDVLGYFNLFFVFIMMIEPKTTPAPLRFQVLFGTGLAVFIFFLIERGFRYEPELFALLVFNALIPRTLTIPNPQNKLPKESV